MKTKTKTQINKEITKLEKLKKQFVKNIDEATNLANEMDLLVYTIYNDDLPRNVARNISLTLARADDATVMLSDITSNWIVWPH